MAFSVFDASCGVEVSDPSEDRVASKQSILVSLTKIYLCLSDRPRLTVPGPVVNIF